MKKKHQANNTNGRLKILFPVVSILLFVCVFAGSTQKLSGRKTVIEMLNSDTMGRRENLGPDIQILKGNVSLLHDSTFMYCDSAYLNRKLNTLQAFDNIRIEQGDTLFIYGDYLVYEGDIKLAKLRHNVRMENRNTTLFTDSFNFDRIKNIGYFMQGGMIVDEQNELTSIYGQYSPGTKKAIFRRNVKLVNDQFILTSDTLNYNTNTKIADIVGPSVIQSDSGTIYSHSGWYNTATDQSQLLSRSTVVSKDKYKTITADTLFYNRTTGFGEAFGNMYLTDTLKKVILTGNYGWYNERTENAFATDSAQFIEYSRGDSLFLHADTLKMITVEKNNHEVKAYHGVRFYRIDLQGVCDSLQYNSKDSVLNLYQDPILWNSGYQLTGDTIQIFMNDSTVDFVHVIDYAFAMEKVDSTYFNQLKGNDLKAYFDAGELKKIYVSGNAETIFYPMEKDSTFIGMNNTQSGFFRLFIKDRKMEKMVIWPDPKGSTTPLPDLTPENKFLKNFILFDYLRPISQKDIFRNVRRKKSDEPQKRSNKFVY